MAFAKKTAETLALIPQFHLPTFMQPKTASEWNIHNLLYPLSASIFLFSSFLAAHAQYQQSGVAWSAIKLSIKIS